MVQGIYQKSYDFRKKRGPSLQTIPPYHAETVRLSAQYPTLSHKRWFPNLLYAAKRIVLHTSLGENWNTTFPKEENTMKYTLYIYTVVPSLSIKFPDPWHKIPEKKTFICIWNTQNLLVRSREWGNNSQSNLESIYNFINVPSFLGFIISESHQSASKLLFSRLFGPSFLQTSSSQIAQDANINIANEKVHRFPFWSEIYKKF